jgi:protein TonB
MIARFVLLCMATAAACACVIGCAGTADRAVLPDQRTSHAAAPRSAKAAADVPPDLAARVIPLKNADSPPKQIRAVAPAYTAIMTEHAAEGRVSAQMLIDERGEVAAVKILRDIGYDSARATREALKQYRFEPARKNGKAVAVWITMSVTFNLP